MKLNFKIHRRTKGIGGSWPEVRTLNTRIIMDIGMPLANAMKKQLNFRKYEKLENAELIKRKILPTLNGFMIEMRI